MFQVENFNNKNLTLLIFLISLFFEKLRKKLSRHGNKYLIDNFSIGTMISKVENLYN